MPTKYINKKGEEKKYYYYKKKAKEDYIKPIRTYENNGRKLKYKNGYKEHSQELITCKDCNATIRRVSLSDHIKTKKHIKNTNQDSNTLLNKCVTCECCDCTLLKVSMKYHLKSKKHINNLMNNSNALLQV